MRTYSTTPTAFSLFTSFLLISFPVQAQWEQLCDFGGQNDGWAVQQQGALFVSSDISGIRFSLDDGATWDEIGEQPGFVVFAFGGDGQYLFAAAEDAVWRSGDLGQTWTEVTTPWTNDQIDHVARFRFLNNTLFCWTTYAPSDGGGLFRTSDHGATWQSCNTGLGVPISPVRAVTEMGGDLYAGSGVGCYRSTNNGSSWAQQSGVIVDAIGSHNSRLISAGFSFNDEVRYSDDLGVTWTVATTAIQIGSSHDDIVPFDGQFVALFRGDPYHSTDNGATWSEFGGMNYTELRSLYAADDTLFAVDADHVYILHATNIGLEAHSPVQAIHAWYAPQDERVHLEGTVPGATYRCRVLDAAGRLVRQTNVLGGDRRDVPFRAVTGLYVVELTSDESTRWTGRVAIP